MMRYFVLRSVIILNSAGIHYNPTYFRKATLQGVTRYLELSPEMSGERMDRNFLLGLIGGHESLNCAPIERPHAKAQ